MFLGTTAFSATYGGATGFGTTPTSGFFTISSDATLASLSVANMLNPLTVTPGNTSYFAFLPFQTSASITLTVNQYSSAQASYASVTVDGTPVSLNTTGTGVQTVTLTAPPNAGQNVNIVVTAPDGTTLAYTLTIVHQSNDATLSALTLSQGSLSPSFAPGTFSYAATVGNSVNAISVFPIQNESNAAVLINGSGGNSVSLSVGNNPISIQVTSQDGTSVLTYTVNVTRQSNDATLSALTLSSGSLSPGFASGTFAYTASVPNSVSTFTVTPTTNDANASATVNGASAATPVTLTVGSNTVIVQVTAQDGTTQSYTVAVTRAASSDATLSALTLSHGSLSPSFASGTQAYTASVAHSVSSLIVTPTTNDTNATATVNAASAATPVTLSVGSNTVTVQVTAQDGSTQSYTVAVTRAASSDATLSALTLSQGSLSPGFASGTFAYTASVPNSVSSLIVTPTTNDANASATVNGASAATPVTLSVGSNTVTVQVTAQDGSTQSYTVAVTRAASSDATLSALVLSQGSLSPSFASGTLAYTALVPNSVSSLVVTPTTNDANATVTVNGASPATPVTLTVGSNTVTVQVTAQDGSTQSYTVAVTRAASSDATLSALTLSQGSLSPSFVSGTLAYTASVVHSVSSLIVTPTTNDANASATVNGASAATPVTLSVGSNTVTVQVTAQDGSTQSYTVAVTRAASSDATLSALALSQGSLSPNFASGTLAYTASVPYSVSSLVVTPTTNDANASATVNGASAATPVTLSVGSNTVTVQVTAQDGSTQSYTVAVTRAAASSDATLSALSLSSGSLSPNFASGTLAYTASVVHSVSSLIVTPTTNDANATATVNGASAATPVTLTVGSNTVTVQVTCARRQHPKLYGGSDPRGGLDGGFDWAFGYGHWAFHCHGNLVQPGRELCGKRCYGDEWSSHWRDRQRYELCDCCDAGAGPASVCLCGRWRGLDRSWDVEPTVQHPTGASGQPCHGLGGA
jgi:DUF971 family protein